MLDSLLKRNIIKDKLSILVEVSLLFFVLFLQTYDNIQSSYHLSIKLNSEGVFDVENEYNLFKVLKDKYGVSVVSIEDAEKLDSYKKISDDDFAKINACFQSIPLYLKSINDANYYSGTYKVIYDKGLGVLQTAAKDPNLFRGNVVTPGTNNNITGQALFQKVHPEVKTLSNIVTASFTVASIATSQYFLARIDNKLASVEKKVNEIKQLLENEKESQLWADGEFLKEVIDNVQYILDNEIYRQATLINVQSIRKTALANIKLFSKQLEILKPELELKPNDNVKVTKEKLNKYKEYLPKYWYSVYLYGFAYALEVLLSNITDSFFLNKVILEIEKMITMYKEGYDVISALINQYIDEVETLKANGRPAKYTKNIGEFFTSSINNPLYREVKDTLLDVGVKRLEEHEKNKKNAMKQEIIDDLKSVITPFSDLEPLKLQIKAINNIDTIYNNRVELIVTGNEAFIKM